MVQGQLPEGGLPAPWILLASPERILVPKPFAALPPRGRRHMLEIKGALNKNSSQEEVVPKYLLTFYGGIFHFRQKFDDQEVPGVYLKTGASKHQCEYARYIEFGDAATGKLQVKGFLESILDNMPVYFVDLTACEDPVAAWLAAQASVRTKRTLSEVRQHGTPIDLHYTTNWCWILPGVTTLPVPLAGSSLRCCSLVLFNVQGCYIPVNAWFQPSRDKAWGWLLLSIQVILDSVRPSLKIFWGMIVWQDTSKIIQYVDR